MSGFRVFGEPFARRFGSGFGTGGGGSILPLTIDFSQYADGTLPSSLSGSTWTIVSGKALNTPVTFGANSVVNGGFAADTNWNKDTNWTIAAGKATKAPGAGTNINQVQSGQAAHQWRRVDFDVVDYAAGGVGPGLGGSAQLVYRTALGSYQQTGLVYTSALANRLWMYNNAAFDGGIDNVTDRLMTFAEFLAVTPPTGITDVTLQIPISAWNPGTGIGIILNLDSITNPQNFVIAWIGGQIAMDKCVNGVYTALAGTTLTFGANKILKLVKTGTTYRMSYDGVQKGLDQTVSDASIINNTIHGIFSTHPDNTIGSISVLP